MRVSRCTVAVSLLPLFISVAAEVVELINAQDILSKMIRKTSSLKYINLRRVSNLHAHPCNLLHDVNRYSPEVLLYFDLNVLVELGLELGLELVLQKDNYEK